MYDSVEEAEKFLQDSYDKAGWKKLGGWNHCGSVSLGFHRNDLFPKKEKGNTPVEIHGKWPAARDLMAGPGMRGGQSGQLTIYSSMAKLRTP